MAATNIKKTMNLGVLDNGDPPSVCFAKISHEFTNEHHVFTSTSLPGLFIADKDPKKALDQVIPLIKKLMYLKTKQHVRVFFGKDIKEFEKAYCSGSPVGSPSLKDTIVFIQEEPKKAA